MWVCRWGSCKEGETGESSWSWGREDGLNPCENRGRRRFRQNRNQLERRVRGNAECAVGMVDGAVIVPVSSRKRTSEDQKRNTEQAE